MQSPGIFLITYAAIVRIDSVYTQTWNKLYYGMIEFIIQLDV